MSEVTRCIPCVRHDDLNLRIVVDTTMPYSMTDEAAVEWLERTARNVTNESITIHKGPELSLSGREWVVTAP